MCGAVYDLFSLLIDEWGIECRDEMLHFFLPLGVNIADKLTVQPSGTDYSEDLWLFIDRLFILAMPDCNPCCIVDDQMYQIVFSALLAITRSLFSTSFHRSTYVLPESRIVLYASPLRLLAASQLVPQSFDNNRVTLEYTQHIKGKKNISILKSLSEWQFYLGDWSKGEMDHASRPYLVLSSLLVLKEMISRWGYRLSTFQLQFIGKILWAGRNKITLDQQRPIYCSVLADLITLKVFHEHCIKQENADTENPLVLISSIWRYAISSAHLECSFDAAISLMIAILKHFKDVLGEEEDIFESICEVLDRCRGGWRQSVQSLISYTLIEFEFNECRSFTGATTKFSGIGHWRNQNQFSLPGTDPIMRLSLWISSIQYALRIADFEKKSLSYLESFFQMSEKWMGDFVCNAQPQLLCQIALGRGIELLSPYLRMRFWENTKRCPDLFVHLISEEISVPVKLIRSVMKSISRRSDSSSNLVMKAAGRLLINTTAQLDTVIDLLLLLKECGRIIDQNSRETLVTQIMDVLMSDASSGELSILEVKSYKRLCFEYMMECYEPGTITDLTVMDIVDIFHSIKFISCFVLTSNAVISLLERSLPFPLLVQRLISHVLTDSSLWTLQGNILRYILKEKRLFEVCEEFIPNLLDYLDFHSISIASEDVYLDDAVVFNRSNYNIHMEKGKLNYSNIIIDVLISFTCRKIFSLRQSAIIKSLCKGNITAEDFPTAFYLSQR
uniref:DUF2428 domain-containing protein n=1 Tax=Heterorhabditis bacteriophora TaxID=37862 RepID=A0A1I7WZQ1_HETBA